MTTENHKIEKRTRGKPVHDSSVYLSRWHIIPTTEQLSAFFRLKRHFPHYGTGCFMRQKSLYHMAEEPVSRHRKGFSAQRHDSFPMTGKANRLTVSTIGTSRKNRVFTAERLSARKYRLIFRLRWIFIHNAHYVFAYTCILCSAPHDVSRRTARAPPSPRRSMKTPSQVALRHVSFIFFRTQNSGV